ncbi:MAG: discoidin domain-containing protein, partial [Spirochaetales bacterium]|nr:discoidin domain-containing protein [Spirochaetales bacterium]
NANRAGNYRPEEEFSGAKISELEVDPFEKETVNTSPSEIQVIDMDLNTNKIKLIAEMKPDMKMKISNLTIWTSRNSAWDDSKVENITIKGSGDFSHKNILRDKEVGIDADQNIIINNDQEGEKGIKYSFYSDNEEINAFSVIKHFDEEYKSDVIGDSLFTTFVYSRYAYNSDKDKVYKTGELLPRVKQLIEYDPDPAFSQYRDGGGYTGKPGDAGDGKLSTQWEINEGKDVQLRIKFKHLYYVNLIIINWGDDYARSYEINASIDNKVERKAIINVADGNGDVDVNVVSEPVQTNYLTIWCKKPKESGKKYSIKEIRVYAGPDFVEYTVEQENKQLKYIGSGTGLLPGYGLWSSDFTDNNSIGVSHFIFNKSIQCKEIQLIDKTTCGHLRINEVMVFPENPINYSIKNGYNIPLYENIDIKIDNPNNNEGYEWYKNNKKVKEDAKYILINNKPSDYLLLKKRTEEGRENHNWINILFSGMINIRQIVLWENDAAASEHSELYNKGISMYHGPEELGNSIFFTDSQEAQHIKDLFGAESKKITTPFFKILTDEGGQYKDKKVGNPIAYSPMGIDSPRTFNYKMYKQREARIKYIDKMKEQNKDVSSFYPDEGRNGKTTLAIDSNNILNYEFSYVNEAHILNEFIKSIYFDENKIYKDFTIDIGKDLAKLPKIDNDIIKPYLPGVYLTSKKGYYDTEDSPIHIDKVAGVDSIGMVSGILSMLDINTYPEGNPDKGIVNLFNKDMGDEIDTYYKMQAANKKGLDANGKPAFYIYNKNKDGSYLQGEYRLKISDIEKCTVIVPEIKKVQEGDLLVKYDEKGEPHIGIVVAKLWEDTTPSTVEEMMNNILVLSIRKGFRMALLGTWGNGSNMFGGFTETPELYHIRRFVTMKKYTDTYVDDEDWEVVKQYVDTLDCDIFLPPDPYTAGQDLHWIPNTDEILEGIKVNITAKSRNQDVDISDRYNIKLLPPRDYGFENGGIEKNSNKKENIYVNKGSGIIYYALDETDKDENGRPVPYELASFVPRNPTEEGIEWKDLTKDTYYRVNYNSEYFNNDGSGKDDVALKVTNEGYLYFVYKDKDGNIKSTQTFGVKAFGNVRPGDDFLLRFGLVEGDDITVDVKEGDFMACYDKKMLWRANLYVDETKLENGNPSGKEDWNDKNFWIGTPEDPNEWEQEGSAKPGGQVSIQPWLQPGGTFYSWEDIEEGIIKNPWTIAETKIYDAISYSYAGDTLKGFNDKMINQAKNLTKVPPDKWSDYSVSSFVPSYHFYYSQQVKTNYTFYGRLTEDRFNTTIINKFNDMNDRNEVKRNFIKSVYIEMDGIMYLKNLIPNKDKKKSLSDDERMTLEAYLKEINYTSESGQSVRITVKDEDTTTHDAGIVCDQLISQAKKYTNNKYKSSVYTYWEVGTETDDINPDNDNEGHLTGNLNYLVPGDVVHYTGHIGIVKSIEYTDERNTVIDNIKIINSTTWYDTWKVQQRQTVRSFLGEANCTLGRMEEN